jgi:hypothetical protein
MSHLEATAPSAKRQNAFSFAHLGGDFDLYALRLRGVGLANMLFPWARCVVASERYGLTRIAPTWPQIAHRHWIRRDPDKRWYGHLFQPAPSEITGFARWNKLLFAKKVPEAQLGPGLAENEIVVFSGMEDRFQQITHDFDFVRSCLLEIVRPEYLRPLRENFSAPIAVHVRLGDFGMAAEDGKLRDHLRTDIHWYKTILGALHSALGPLETHIFSDGTNEELAPLLAMQHVRRTSFGHSISDILALSNSRILVTSNSTFSMWAAYLGRPPAIWHPNGLSGRIYHDNPAKELETTGKLTQDFLAQCILSLNQRQLA